MKYWWFFHVFWEVAIPVSKMFAGDGFPSSWICALSVFFSTSNTVLVKPKLVFREVLSLWVLNRVFYLFDLQVIGQMRFIEQIFGTAVSRKSCDFSESGGFWFCEDCSHDYYLIKWNTNRIAFWQSNMDLVDFCVQIWKNSGKIDFFVY